VTGKPEVSRSGHPPCCSSLAKCPYRRQYAREVITWGLIAEPQRIVESVLSSNIWSINQSQDGIYKSSHRRVDERSWSAGLHGALPS